MSPLMTNILGCLEQRRRDMGVPYHVLAETTGLGIATVQRTLKGTTEARMDTMGAIAAVLGVTLGIGANTTIIEEGSVDELLEERARQKAEKLVAHAQATAGLEAQAVTEGTIQQAKKELIRRLLVGSKRKLWES